MKYEDHMFRVEREDELAVLGAMVDLEKWSLGVMPMRLRTQLIYTWIYESWTAYSKPGSVSALATRAMEMGPVMRRALTDTIYKWLRRPGGPVLRIEGDEIYPGSASGVLAMDPSWASMAKRHAYALGLKKHGPCKPGNMGQVYRVDPRWARVYRETLAIGIHDGAVTQRALAAFLVCIYHQAAGASWVPGKVIGDYLNLSTQRVSDTLDRWLGAGLKHRRAPYDQRQVEFRFEIPRARAEFYIAINKQDQARFDIPEDFHPNSLELPGMRQAGQSWTPLSLTDAPSSAHANPQLAL